MDENNNQKHDHHHSAKQKMKFLWRNAKISFLLHNDVPERFLV
ncbi:hypothetical protein PB1_12454 [Bacillus methanolicus PB1]|uniref:Uncharacterized protein n=1 Tax=Bacillus methanolicus PB1 TaxID=997296 RepID=I3DVV0_BACMT|nr:hypothetical protein [Bacillus methanolicus]EIJ78371.1 hypothetical protein PB1_12454 [Bacillus methanolicus PB1]